MAKSPRIVGLTPVLCSLDLHQTADFYREHLDFAPRHVDPGRYGILERDGLELHFWAGTDRKVAEQTSCRIAVVGIDALYDRCKRAGVVHPKAPLRTEPWGHREFGMVDGDGNLLTFHEPVAKTPKPRRTRGTKERKHEAAVRAAKPKSGKKRR
jgi:catechol 2,3-dioxygenase-like lactoylglutathione lyase family enzyme